MKPIAIADFSETPAGRDAKDGSENNGTLFREKVLIPAIQNLGENEKLRIIIDNVEGYGSSFLEEAFGGIVRDGIMDKEKFLKVLSLEYEDDYFKFYERRIISYINDAKPQ